ncbi:TPA: hypothetical protein PMB55_000731 [Vibrio cholerae]|nr:hypothetical protein [Vibrio cholerae]
MAMNIEQRLEQSAKSIEQSSQKAHDFAEKDITLQTCAGSRDSLPKVSRIWQENFARQMNQHATEFQDRFALSQQSLPWQAGITISDSLQRYHIGVQGEEGYKEFLPNPVKLPFETAATLAEDLTQDRWLENGVPNKHWTESKFASALEKSLGANARIWPKDRDLQVGDVIPSAQDTVDGLPITHLVVNGNAYAMSPVVSGLVADLTATQATIGGTIVSIFLSIPSSSDIPFVTAFGASEFDSGSGNDAAFQKSLELFNEINIPPNVTLRTASGLNVPSNARLNMGGGSFLAPGADNINVVNFAGDFAYANAVRVANTGGFTGCTSLGFLPIETLKQVGQRYNKVEYIYLDGLDTGVAFQCGDYLKTGFASGCWYNRIMGGEIRNCNNDVIFKKGLRTDINLTNPPATPNRNTIQGVTSHFTKVRGVYIEAGAENILRDFWVESTIKTGAPVVAFEIAETSPEAATNPNERNFLDNCGTESVGVSIKNYNKFTRIRNWNGEVNPDDEYGNAMYIDGRDPSRAPLATPYSYLQNAGFDSRFEIGKEHLFLGKGIQYCGGSREFPTAPTANFKVNDRDFEWKTFDLSASLTNATLVSGLAKYKKVANVVTVLVRCRFNWTSGNVSITLPHPSTSDYTSSVGGSGFARPIMVAKSGTIELGLGLHLAATIFRINSPADGWGATNNEFHVEMTYEA